MTAPREISAANISTLHNSQAHTYMLCRSGLGESHGMQLGIHHLVTDAVLLCVGALVARLLFSLTQSAPPAQKALLHLCDGMIQSQPPILVSGVSCQHQPRNCTATASTGKLKQQQQPLARALRITIRGKLEGMQVSYPVLPMQPHPLSSS